MGIGIDQFGEEESDELLWTRLRDATFNSLFGDPLMDHIDTLISTKANFPRTIVEICAGKDIAFSKRFLKSHLKNYNQETPITIIANDIIYSDENVRIEVLHSLIAEIHSVPFPDRRFISEFFPRDEHQLLDMFGEFGINFQFHPEKAENLTFPEENFCIGISSGLNYIDGSLLINSFGRGNLKYIFLANCDHSGPQSRFSENRILTEDLIDMSKQNGFQIPYITRTKATSHTNATAAEIHVTAILENTTY